jgi:hypothetical protein
VNRRENHNDGYKKESGTEEGSKKGNQKEVAAFHKVVLHKAGGLFKKSACLFLCP